jgi:hypothetical protein
MINVAIDAAMRLEEIIACELRLNSFKYTLGRDLEKARIRQVARGEVFRESAVESQRLRDAAVSTNLPEMP